MTFRKDKKIIFVVIITVLSLIYPIKFVYNILSDPSNGEDLISSLIGKIIISYTILKKKLLSYFIYNHIEGVSKKIRLG